MDSSLRPSPTVNRMSILDKPRTFANPDDLCSEIIGWLQRAPNMDSANAYLEDSQRIHTEVFAKCFQSKERVRRMIGEVRNEDFILLLLQYIAVDRQQIRAAVDRRFTEQYLMLRQQTGIMLGATDPTIRQKLALYNDFKVRLILKCLVEPFQKKLPAKVLLAWLALLPVDMKGGLAGGNYLPIKNELLSQQLTMDYTILFDLVMVNLAGTDNLVLLLDKITVDNPVVAEMMIQYCIRKQASIGQLFVLLSQKIRPAKIVDLAREAVARCALKPVPQFITDLYLKYALPIILKDMMAKSVNFAEGERLIREMLQYPQCLPVGSISKELANQLMAGISKSHIYEHMVLLQALFNKCMTAEAAATYCKHLEGYIQKYRDGEFVQQNSSMPDSRFRGSAVDVDYHQQVMQSMEYVGLPNIGNTCYINCMLHALYFCRSFTEPYFRAVPEEKSLVMIQKVFGDLRNRDRTKLKQMMGQLKSLLPEEFSADWSQQDVMELGRYLIDKFVSTNTEMRNVFEIKIREMILCPAGDIIEDREITEYFMMLSFINPRLFSKLGSQSLIATSTDLTKMIEGDFFSNTQIDSEFQCDKCKRTFHERTRQQRLMKMPDLLVVVLSRFSYDAENNQKRKVCDRVRMDNYLIFGHLTSKQHQDNYKLVAFINHMGKNAESGHYQCYVRHPRDDNKWLNFDDEFVTQTPYSKIGDLVSNFSQYDSPYVLFYERI